MVRAKVFVRNILKDFDYKKAKQYPEEVRQATLFFCGQFIDIYDSCIAGLKSHSVIR